MTYTSVKRLRRFIDQYRALGVASPSVTFFPLPLFRIKPPSPLIPNVILTSGGRSTTTAEYNDSESARHLPQHHLDMNDERFRYGVRKSPGPGLALAGVASAYDANRITIQTLEAPGKLISTSVPPSQVGWAPFYYGPV
ncbi:hypothetical protein D9757_009001 [Collybiopsis confluens]|uniref:Uncharacterized protein n=1 Tax=Collybiopsis confluens TaxID=2823264 RepID=A0A8H5LZH8_9AGAR|nr:hypothetical protein D9757_009001 [Collybiopsis confluens]